MDKQTTNKILNDLVIDLKGLINGSAIPPLDAFQPINLILYINVPYTDFVTKKKKK